MVDIERFYRHLNTTNHTVIQYMAYMHICNMQIHVNIHHNPTL